MSLASSCVATVAARRRVAHTAQVGVVRKKRSDRPAIVRGPALGALVLTPILLLAGCGSSGQPQQSALSSASGPSASVVVPTTTGSLSVPVTVSSVPGGSITTVQGTVTRGVESGCVVLVDASGAVVANLQGWDLQAHPLDTQVEVTGTFEPDLMTTCQQGTPFEVTAVVSR